MRFMAVSQFIHLFNRQHMFYEHVSKQNYDFTLVIILKLKGVVSVFYNNNKHSVHPGLCCFSVSHDHRMNE